MPVNTNLSAIDSQCLRLSKKFVMKENKQPRVKILVACHKADPNIRQDDIYMPIQVGKALHPELDF